MKNTKRILLPLILGVATSVFCAAFVTACGGEKEHTHEWGNETVVQQGDCTTDKVLQYTCTVCGETKEETVAAPGHTYGEAVVVDATCLEAGSSTKTCTVCGYQDVTVIEALGHDYVYTTVTAATCTENGTQKITCLRCDLEETETIAKLGHDWGEWTVVQEGDCYTDEIQERTCNRCQDVDRKETPAANAHSYGDDNYCTVCGAYKYHKITVVDAEGNAVAGVTVKLATEKDGIVEAQETDENGLASFKATEDITYSVQLYGLPNGASYSKVTAAAHTEEGHEFTITLGSDKVETLEYNVVGSNGPETSEEVGENRYYYDLTSLGEYKVVIPGEIDSMRGKVIGEIRATLTCDYIGGAVYVLSWTNPQVTVSVSTPGKGFASTALVTEADKNGVYSMSFPLAYGSTATITFSVASYSLDYSSWDEIVTYDDCPYPYTVSLSVANSELKEGSADMPYSMSLGSNTAKGIKNEEGKYTAYFGFNAAAGDYTFSFTGATVQYGYSATYLSDSVTSGQAITVEYESTFILYVVSDTEIIDIDVSFAYTPGSIDAPYVLTLDENTVRSNAYIYLAFTPEENGKFTLRGSGYESFTLYASLDDVDDWENVLTYGNGILIYEYKAGNTYYISVYSETDTLTLTKYNAATDDGYSADTAVAMGLDQSVSVENATRYYTFTAETAGYYTLRSSGYAYFELYSASDYSYENIITSASEILVFQAEAGTTYYLTIGYAYSSGVTATLSAYNAETDAGLSKAMPKEITAGESEIASTQMYYTFTPSESGTYELTIDDAYMTVYFYTASDYTQSNVYLNQSQNTVKLEGETTYYVSVGSVYMSSEVTFSFSKQYGSAEDPYTMSVGPNTAKGIKNEDGTYTAYFSFEMEEGDYTFTFTDATVQYGYSAMYLFDYITSGQAVTVGYGSTYTVYVVSDTEIINIDISFAYTPGSLKDPYALTLGKNTVRMYAYIYLTFTPEKDGKFTLRGSGSEEFVLYASLDDAKDYNAVTYGEGILIYEYQAGKTYYISVYSNTDTLTLTEYNAETDAGYSADTAVAMGLDQSVSVEYMTRYYKFTATAKGKYTLRLTAAGSVSLYLDEGFNTYFDGAYGTTIFIFQAEADKNYYLTIGNVYDSGATATLSAYNSATDAGYSADTAVAMELGKSVPVESMTRYYKFTATAEGKYTLRLTDTGSISLYSDEEFNAYLDDAYGTIFIFQAKAGSTYYLTLSAYSGATATLSAYNAETDAGYSADTAVAMGLNQSVPVENMTRYYTFTATAEDYYTLRSSGSAYIALYSASDYSYENMITSASGILVFQAKAGTTYYLTMSSYSDATATLGAYNEATDAGLSKAKPKEITEGESEIASTQMYYTFTPSESGTYELTISDAYTGVSLYTANDYSQSYYTYLSQSQNTVALEGEKTYYVFIYAYYEVTFSFSKKTETGGNEGTVEWKLDTEYSFNVPQNKATYSATITVDAAGDYTFTMSSTDGYADYSYYTLTVNGTAYTLSKANEAITIALIQGPNTIQFASTERFGTDVPVTVKITAGTQGGGSTTADLTVNGTYTVTVDGTAYVTVYVETAGEYVLTLDQSGVEVYTEADYFGKPLIGETETSGEVTLSAGVTKLVIRYDNSGSLTVTLTLTQKVASEATD